MMRVLKYVLCPAVIFVAFLQNDISRLGLACIAVLTWGILVMVFFPDAITDQLNP